MKLSRAQFNILVYLEGMDEDVSQRKISLDTGISLGLVNKIIKETSSMGYVEDNKITAMGRQALEPYRVKKAIFIAAGFGARLVPITLTVPKPLVKVNGKAMIETLLEAVAAVGIEEIIIVRGYLKEQFDQLLFKYPMIRFVDNLEYSDSKNISSMMKVRNEIENCYILDADLILYNAKLITKYQYSSNYLGIPVERTDDWCVKTKNGVIKKVMIGGTNCQRLIGISYWNKEDGKKLSKHIKEVYEMPGGKERFWDQVPLEYFIKEYKIIINECCPEDIVEIDTYNELKQIDRTYC